MRVSDDNVIKLDGNYITAEEFMKRMGWRNMQTVYFAIKNDRVPGVIKIGNSWLIPSNAVAIDKRRFKKKKKEIKKAIRQYLFVVEDIELWAEGEWVYLYDGHTMIREHDTPENRAKLIDMAKEF